MHIAIIGPANPDEFRTDLETVERFPTGLGGSPVNGLVRSLLDLGHRVSLFTASPGETVVWRAKGAKLSVVAVPYRQRARHRAMDFFGSERRALARELAVCDADVFHAHWTYEFALACIDAGAEPLIVTAHDAPLTILRHLPDSYRVIRAIMALRVRISIRNLTAVAPYLATRWRKEMFFGHTIAVIPNPVPCLEFPASSRPDHAVVLDVADGSKRKNVKALLRAFPAVKIVFPSAELRLVGGGLGVGEAVEAWAVKNELTNGVHFLGALDRTEIARQYAEATVFCHPSLEEAQPMCLLEAMDALLPIVAGASSGGVPWTLFDGAAGRLVDVGRPSEIANALIATISNPEASSSIAHSSVHMMNERYAPVVIARMYLIEYARVVGEKRI